MCEYKKLSLHIFVVINTNDFEELITMEEIISFNSNEGNGVQSKNCFRE